MNFKIQFKNEKDWNPVLLKIYVGTNSKILEWILWKLEQLRTPKDYDDGFDDRENFILEAEYNCEHFEEDWNCTPEEFVESMNKQYEYLRKQEIM